MLEKVQFPALHRSNSVLEGAGGTSPSLGNQASGAYLTTENELTYNK